MLGGRRDPPTKEAPDQGGSGCDNSAGIDDFINACFNYPSLSELYKYAAYDALGALNHRTGRARPRDAAKAA